MITLEDSRKLLKFLGEEFLDLYTNELFKFQTNIKLLIDDTTFYLKCRAALSKMNEKYSTSYSYDDCLEAFDCIYTNYDVYTNESLQRNNQLIALSITVFQVLLAYKELPENVNPDTENGYYFQLKDNYPSLRIKGDFASYFKKQIPMWETVKLLFKNNSKNFQIPERTSPGYKNVKYPHSQRILKPTEFRYLCAKFKNLDKNKEYTLESFINFFSYDLQRIQQQEFIAALLFNAYKSLKSIEVKPKYYSSNDEINEILYFDSDGNLSDEYNILDIDNTALKTLYFYKADEKLWCTEPSEKEVDVGILCSITKIHKYEKQYSKIIKTKSNNFSFLYFEIDAIKNTSLYSKFYSNEKPKRLKQYRIVDGLKIDGRNNSYDQKFLPDIIFDFECPIVKISDTYDEEEVFDTQNNRIRLSIKEIKNKFKGLIKIHVPNDYIPPIEINIINCIENTDFKEKCFRGWNLKSLSPCTDNSDEKLIGLKFFSNQNNSNLTPPPVRNESRVIVKTNPIPVTYPYVNCNYSEKIYISNLDKFKDEMRTCISSTCKLGKEEPITMIIEAFKKRINDNSKDFTRFISYYRLIKKCVLELYDYHCLFIIFYATDSTNNELKPFIKRVSYKPNIYKQNESLPFFEDIQVYGRRPKNTNCLLISTDRITTSLKHLTANINYKVKINPKILNNTEYAIDYIEFYEVLLHTDNAKSLLISPGIFRFDLSNVNISDIKNPSESIDFSRCQILEKIDRKIYQNTHPLRYLQQMFYRFVQIKGCVTWNQITDFMIDKTSDYNIYDLFYPLYNLGLIDVCWLNNEAHYFAVKIKLETSIGTIKSKTQFPDFQVFPDDISKKNNPEIENSLSILKSMCDFETIIKSWTKVSIDPERLSFGYYFGSFDGFEKPKYKKINNIRNFNGLCRESNDKRLMAITPAYFKFSLSEIYQVPKRSVNPNAERIAKIVMRKLHPEYSKRFEYNKKSKNLTCYISDIPIPILRALFACNPLKLANQEIFLNKIEINKFCFNITDDIYKELIRIMSKDVFEEIENA